MVGGVGASDLGTIPCSLPPHRCSHPLSFGVGFGFGSAEVGGFVLVVVVDDVLVGSGDAFDSGSIGCPPSLIIVVGNVGPVAGSVFVVIVGAVAVLYLEKPATAIK